MNLKASSLLLSIWLMGAGVLQARYIASYTTKIGPADHLNSHGSPLNRVADILQQDRANVHRYGIRDPEDETDPYFYRRSRRARIGRMLRRGWVEPDLEWQILRSNPLIRVDIYTDHLEVRNVGFGQPTKISSRKVGIPAKFPGVVGAANPFATTYILHTETELANDALRQLQTQRTPLTFGLFNLNRGTRLDHQIIGLYPVREGNVDKIYVVASTNAASKQLNHCHGCAPSISIFLYRRNAEGWFLEARSFNVGQYGTWGEGPSKDQIHTISIAKDLSALNIISGFATMGWSQTNYALILHDNTGLWQSYFKVHASDNLASGMGPKTDWKTEISYHDGPNKVRDISVHRFGIYRGKRVDQRLLYTFDGATFTSRDKDPLGKIEE